MNRADAIRLARELRKNSTKAERQFWFYVRNRRFHGYKFTRQIPIEFKLYDNKANFFIADFYCHHFRLIVEIDGDYHQKPEIKH
jgi:very-short-patch-repair endonuclease